ncbi:Fe-S cluster assembly protein SufD [Microbacterium sp. zg.Y1090]|uniref:Fe-S cluster assembly protein SufD n=1 Tax=Microbacterium TaxID=33882 RepID=UPI00214CB3AE|nr:MULTISPECIES: Fe-S cluster assembly protein SufD [unclassified Microbacterium]MCR2812012.1 Fe-S cluster assembly protein SufD [Microbacterium sp. zg.Y1084]MCR2818549.1 Fe-S cluster assembly protein SufD [Microbacterium sp. zg.Y1090]MDL5486362.1 Fe-S cluster assembly protein SufD [Microbacterium sp. zg-Y1211]WIM29554.1 Fe-S cluster assembly protein SufD [Microbacterium sp. zg-Y1090]
MTSVTQAPATRGEGHIDPAAAFVPVQTRSERPTSFDPADFGAPTGREVNWKHTPLTRLGAVLTDEEPDATAVAHRITGPEGLVIASTGHDAPARGEVFRPEDLPAAIAWKRSPDAVHVRIPAGVEQDDLLRIDLAGRDAGAHGADHIIVEAMPQSAATVLLYHSGTAQYAQNVEIIVRDGARLNLVTVQRWDEDAVHVASHQARVDRDASLTHVVVSLGGGVVRVNPSVELSGAGSSCKLYGVSFSDSGQHLESQVYMHHKGPHTKGDVLYKGALQGESARSVWIGDVLIGPDAAGTDSYEANRNLVLTDGARAESIPNLEIETGDIQGAGHASATGRFDDEQLFYLQARGIGEAEARRLVVLGFLGEIVQKTGIPSLEEELTAAILAELDAEPSA